jgi:dUTP pyrophosphatase
MNINFKKLHPGAKPPFRATVNSAGADLFAFIGQDIIINRGERLLIATGIAVEIPPGFGGFIFPRSSISSKHGISLANCVGVIDADYRGEVKVSLINHSNEPYTIKNGDRIAQLAVLPVERVEFTEKSTLSATERGEGGFGSTGKS